MATTAMNGWGRGCLVVVGVSHHAASLDVRERLAMDAAAWRDLAPAGAPGVLLSTCNRVEVYAWASGRGRRVIGQLKRALARAAGAPVATLDPHLFAYAGSGATLHLVRVAAGLDSLVVGEEQIRGQVRKAFAAATATTPLPAPLVGIFHRALYAARRVRLETPLGRHPSVATAGVDVALGSAELAGVTTPTVLVLGAGVMAKSALGALLAAGRSAVVLNRTLAHAERLAAVLGPAVSAAPLDALPRLLPHTDLVVCGTAARRPVLDAPLVLDAMRARGSQPLVILDIAVPRDAEPGVREIPGVRLIDLDDLEGLCPVGAPERHVETARVEALAVEEAAAIEGWLRLRAIGPAILELRGFGEQVRADELRRATSRLKGLSPEQLAVVEELTERIVKKLLHGPTVALRETAEQPRASGRSRTLVQQVLRADRSARREKVRC